MQPHPFPAGEKIFTVTEITRDIRQLLEDNFHSVWLKGEISNFRRYASGHFYFTLKDENAQIPAVMFRGRNRGLKFELEDGMSVVVHGRLTVYEVRGHYQIIIDQIKPDGVGALQIAFEQLKKKLAAEGLFDKDRKRPLPALPVRVGIVTSLHGAAVHDMVTVLTRRFPGIHIVIYPVRVQGEGAAEEIAGGIRYFSKTRVADVIIVGRGGGSLEDLWAFNEEIVARAIFDCAVPVISAVGHETDFSIADFVADVRAPTPSAAAELCVPVKAELMAGISRLRGRLVQALGHRIRHDRKHLHFLIKSLPTPQVILDRLLLRLSDFQNRACRVLTGRLREYVWQLRQHRRSLATGIEKHLVGLGHRLKNHCIKIELLSPKNVLKRGYVIARDRAYRLVTRRKGLKSGDELELTFYDGGVISVIK